MDIFRWKSLIILFVFETYTNDLKFLCYILAPNISIFKFIKYLLKINVSTIWPFDLETATSIWTNVLSAPDWPQIGPVNLVIREVSKWYNNKGDTFRKPTSYTHYDNNSLSLNSSIFCVNVLFALVDVWTCAMHIVNKIIFPILEMHGIRACLFCGIGNDYFRFDKPLTWPQLNKQTDFFWTVTAGRTYVKFPWPLWLAWFNSIPSMGK